MPSARASAATLAEQVAREGPFRPGPALEAMRSLLASAVDARGLAAFAFFLLTGEGWGRPADAGERRSLATARRLPAEYRHPRLLSQLDRALLVGERTRDAAAFARVLLPVLADAAIRAAGAPGEGRATAVAGVEWTPLCSVVDVPAPRRLPGDVHLRPGSVAFLGRRLLVRDGARLFYVVGPRALKVRVPPELAAMVAACRWMGRLAGGGVALISPERLVEVRGGAFVARAPPEGGVVEAAVADGTVLAVVTVAPDGTRSLMISTDRGARITPMAVAGKVVALAGAARGVVAVVDDGGRERVVLVGPSGAVLRRSVKVSARLEASHVVATADGVAWVAGPGGVARVDRDAVTLEPAERDGAPPVALALDVSGRPWLATERSVLRRHAGQKSGAFWRYSDRGAGPALIALGPADGGMRAVDETGAGAVIAPVEEDQWTDSPSQPSSSTSVYTARSWANVRERWSLPSSRGTE